MENKPDDSTEVQEARGSLHVPDMCKYEMHVPETACSEMQSSRLEPVELAGGTRC